MKRTVPILITFLAGVVMTVAYFVPSIEAIMETGAIWFDILAAIAFILGGGNLLRSHGEKVFKQQPGWGYSGIAVVTFLVTLALGLFKVGVPPPPGLWTSSPLTSGETVALAQLDVAVEQGTSKTHALSVTVRKATPGETLPVRIDGVEVGSLTVNESGRGDLKIAAGSAQAATLAKVEAAQTGAIQIGSLSGTLQPYTSIMGVYNEGGAFWWMYEYWFKPLQQTTFAMLAFYVASAAFRAFRAKNIESVLLLGTAFVILLGRTFIGTWLTAGLPDEGFWSFFQIPNLTGWIMSVFNTAGNRAIAIGIALGIASTSLKVIFGIDRSYLGSSE